MSITRPSDIPGVTTSVTKTGILQIILSTPKKFNALTMAMYEYIGDLLRFANIDPQIKIVYISGEGDFYSSGADLSQYSSPDSFALKNLEFYREKIIHFVDSHIECEKPIIAAVNGPAIGISFSLLALCDVVYCSETAYFSAPFMQLALAPEACSSYLFPKIFGNSLGREIILFGRKLKAEEALKCGFVSDVLRKEGFRELTLKRTEEFAKFDAQNLKEFKGLMKKNERELLKKVNRDEINFLFNQWQRGEFLERMKKLIEINRKKAANSKAKL